MFLKNFKSQFKWYLLISVVFWMFQSWLSRGIPLDPLGLIATVFFRLVVASLTAFVFYTGVHCISVLLGWVRTFLKWSQSRFSRLLVILLVIFGVSICMPPQRADAIGKHWKAAKPLIKKGTKIIGIGWAVDKAVDFIDGLEDEAVTATKPSQTETHVLMSKASMMRFSINSWVKSK